MDWNVRVFTEADFDHLCESSGVQVLQSSMAIDGAYCVYNSLPIIFINRSLKGSDKLRIQFHELAHHWLHFPGVQFFLNTHSKIELEANIVSTCALIPFPVLASRSPAEIQEEFGYSIELIYDRCDIYRTWNI